MSTSIQQQMVNIFLTCNTLPTVKKIPLKKFFPVSVFEQRTNSEPILTPHSLLEKQLWLQNNKLNLLIPWKKVCYQTSLQMQCCCTEPSLQWSYLSSGVLSLCFFFFLRLTGEDSLSDLFSELQDIKTMPVLTVTSSIDFSLGKHPASKQI